LLLIFDLLVDALYHDILEGLGNPFDLLLLHLAKFEWHCLFLQFLHFLSFIDFLLFLFEQVGQPYSEFLAHLKFFLIEIRNDWNWISTLDLLQDVLVDGDFLDPLLHVLFEVRSNEVQVVLLLVKVNGTLRVRVRIYFFRFLFPVLTLLLQRLHLFCSRTHLWLLLCFWKFVCLL
jgi:hypothetical protein